MSGHGPNPNAAAPPVLRAFLDGIDMLGRLDGWMGAACLVALTCLMLGEVLVRALSDIFPWVPADIPVAWEYGSYLMAAAFTLTRLPLSSSTCADDSASESTLPAKNFPASSNNKNMGELSPQTVPANPRGYFRPRKANISPM